MKRFFLATTALVMLSVGGPAIAADMAVKARPLPPPPPPCAQFGGFYLGGHVGWGWQEHKFNDRDGLGAFIDTGLGNTLHAEDDNWGGGVGIGYNWQSRCTVFGVVADWSWTNLRAEALQLDGDQGPGGATADTMSISHRLRWFGTVRAKAGVVVDNLLLYVTGGVAYANFDRTWTFFEDGPATTGTFSNRRTKWGWTAGVGTEWAIWDNWSVMSEFLYMRFERDTQTFTGDGIIGALGQPYRFESFDNVWVTKIGLNYRFSYGPVVARY